MLEDPSYDQVVRWGNDGKTFVVLEVGPTWPAGSLQLRIVFDMDDEE